MNIYYVQRTVACRCDQSPVSGWRPWGRGKSTDTTNCGRGLYSLFLAAKIMKCWFVGARGIPHTVLYRVLYLLLPLELNTLLTELNIQPFLSLYYTGGTLILYFCI